MGGSVNTQTYLGGGIYPSEVVVCGAVWTKRSLVVTIDEGKPSPLPSSAAGQVAQLKPSVPTLCTGKVCGLLLYYIILLSVANALELSVACPKVPF